jgi:hypothetical protein
LAHGPTSSWLLLDWPKPKRRCARPFVSEASEDRMTERTLCRIISNDASAVGELISRGFHLTARPRVDEVALELHPGARAVAIVRAWHAKFSRGQSLSRAGDLCDLLRSLPERWIRRVSAHRKPPRMPAGLAGQPTSIDPRSCLAGCGPGGARKACVSRRG